MSKLKEFVQGLQKATGKAALPVRFWADYSEGDTHTFQDALDKYAEYCGDLNPAQQKAEV